MFPTPPPPRALIDDGEIAALVSSLLGERTPSGQNLVIKIGGVSIESPSNLDRDEVEQMRAAVQELKQSLQMHGSASSLMAVQVGPPDVRTLRRALAVLGDPRARRNVLESALEIFGRRVIDPIAHALEPAELLPRLRVWRDRIFDESRALRLHGDAATVLRGDLEKLLGDEYLAMIADYEERSVRPRLRTLASQVLDLLGHVFHRAFRTFGDHGEAIAVRIVRRVPDSMPLAELPERLRSGFVVSIADFLESETRAELEGSLHTLGRTHSDILGDRRFVLPEDGYAELAGSCWNVMTSYG